MNWKIVRDMINAQKAVKALYKDGDVIGICDSHIHLTRDAFKDVRTHCGIKPEAVEYRRHTVNNGLELSFEVDGVKFITLV